MNDAFVKSYMRMARFISQNKISCYSRGIGTVIVSPTENRVLGTGYNGPPRGVPNCDSYEYLKDVVYPQLTENDREYLIYKKDGCWTDNWINNKDGFANSFANCKTCPRKLIGAKSGERLELCSCAHSEANAITNAAQSVHGAYLFCWCGPPCFETCAKAIVNAGIARVYCLAGDESVAYGSFKTKWLFEKSGVELVPIDRNWVNE